MLLATSPASAAQEGLDILRVPPPGPDGSTQGYPHRLGRPKAQAGDDFYSVVTGRFLDEAPARRLAERLHKKGLLTFVSQRTLEEERTLGDQRIGDFYLVMAGLFGLADEAQILGQRLVAEGLIPHYQVTLVGAPAELESTTAQNRALSQRASDRAQQARDKASEELPPSSPAATGEAFKQRVHGRYVGSFRDPAEARQQARLLSSAGWVASVEETNRGGSLWYRVYLAPAEDARDMKAEPKALAAAKRSAARQPGLVILADMFGLRGSVSSIIPNGRRTDASACAGFSEAGRLSGCLSRLLNQIPDSSYTAALLPLSRQPIGDWSEIPQRLKQWWTDESPPPRQSTVYGPAIFNRPAMQASIAKLKADEEPASLALGLGEVAPELASIPGRKLLLVFSEFNGPDRPQDVLASFKKLRERFGSSLEAFFIYGDSHRQGYELAQSLAQEAGSAPAWDGCLLMNDNVYFQRFIDRLKLRP